MQILTYISKSTVCINFIVSEYLETILSHVKAVYNIHFSLLASIPESVH